MSYAWMRRIDSWIGKPILWLLGIFSKKPQSLYGDTHPEKPPEKIIFSRFIGLGSVVPCLPLLKALRDQGVKIAFWSFPGQSELIRVSGFADEIWVIQPSFRGFLSTLWRTWRAARKFKSTAFVDLEPASSLSAILARTSGSKLRIGMMSGNPLREAIFTHLVSLTPERKMLDTLSLVSQLLGVSWNPSKTLASSFPPLPDLSKIKTLLPAFPGRRKVVINVNSSDFQWQRTWPEDHWVALCDRLTEDRSIDLVFPGGHEDIDRVQSLIARLRDPSRAFNIAGTATLVELMKQLSESQLMISVESGILHLAAWGKTPVIAIFGPETPRIYVPATAPGKVHWAGLPCSPCFAASASKFSACRDNQCMKRVTPDQVYKSANEFLQAGKASDAA